MVNAIELARLRSCFPSESEEELESRLAEIRLGKELYQRARARQAEGSK